MFVLKEFDIVGLKKEEVLTNTLPCICGSDHGVGYGMVSMQ